MACLTHKWPSPVQEKVPSEQIFILVWGTPFLSVKRNDKKILEHRFGRDDESRSSFWTWYEEMES